MANPATERGVYEMMVIPRGISSIKCECSTCTDKKEIDLLQQKVYALEQQIKSMNKIINILKEMVKYCQVTER